jgi:hypothetical protein
VRVDFPHPEWGARADAYQEDLRPPSSEGETWEVEVRSSELGEPLTLAISEADATSPDLALRLMDREQGTSINASLATTGEVLRYQILPFRDRPYRLAIVVGTASYLAGSSEQAFVPDRLALDPVAPNPSRGLLAFDSACRARHAGASRSLTCSASASQSRWTTSCSLPAITPWSGMGTDPVGDGSRAGSISCVWSSTVKQSRGGSHSSNEWVASGLALYCSEALPRLRAPGTSRGFSSPRHESTIL